MITQRIAKSPSSSLFFSENLFLDCSLKQALRRIFQWFSHGAGALEPKSPLIPGQLTQPFMMTTRSSANKEKVNGLLHMYCSEILTLELVAGRQGRLRRSPTRYKSYRQSRSAAGRIKTSRLARRQLPILWNSSRREASRRRVPCGHTYGYTDLSRKHT